MHLKKMISIIAVVSLLLSCTVTAFAQDNFKYSDEYKSSPYYEKLNAAIDNFGDKMVLTDMHTALVFTFTGYRGSHNLGKTVNIISLDAEACFDFFSHFLCPGFGTENTCLKL